MATSIIKTDELRLLNDQVVMSDGALTENVTFPAGHIIQHAFNTCGLTHNSNLESTTSLKELICTVDFTKIHPTSRILIKTFGSVYKNNTYAGAGVRIYLQRISPTFKDMTSVLYDTSSYNHPDGQGEQYMWGAYNTSTVKQINMISNFYFDDDNISDKITYGLYYSSSVSGHIAYIYPNVGLEVMELKT